MKVINKKLRLSLGLGIFFFQNGIYVLELCHLCHKWHFSELLKYFSFMTLYDELNVCASTVTGGSLRNERLRNLVPGWNFVLRWIGIDWKIPSRNKLWKYMRIYFYKATANLSSDYFRMSSFWLTQVDKYSFHYQHSINLTRENEVTC